MDEYLQLEEDWTWTDVWLVRFFIGQDLSLRILSCTWEWGRDLYSIFKLFFAGTNSKNLAPVNDGRIETEREREITSSRFITPLSSSPESREDLLLWMALQGLQIFFWFMFLSSWWKHVSQILRRKHVSDSEKEAEKEACVDREMREVMNWHKGDNIHQVWLLFWYNLIVDISSLNTSQQNPCRNNWHTSPRRMAALSDARNHRLDRLVPWTCSLGKAEKYGVD